MNETQLIETVRTAAEQGGLTQKQIAEKMGTKQSNVSKYLTGKRVPTLDTFVKLAGAVELEIVLQPLKVQKTK